MKCISNILGIELKPGQTITVKAWGKFDEERLTCVDVYHDGFLFNEVCYKFDTGIVLCQFDLESNLLLWESRNGFEISE